MSLELSYSLRHLQRRRLTTALTVLGIALVVFVYTVTLMLADGLRQTLSTTGSMNNAIVIRNGAQNEIQSGIPRDHAAAILADESVERLPDGTPAATTDVVVLVSLKKRADGQPSNVTIRGVSPLGFSLKPGIKIMSGRLPAPGTREILVGESINSKFANTTIGDHIRLVGADWTVVGILSAGNSGFSSEIWGDSEVLMPAFRRDRFSSITFRIKSGADFEALQARLQDDRRFTVTVKREQEFYSDQSKTLSKFITILGSVVSIIFSIGAIVGAMITMYSAVANRTREVGILRALGFPRRAIFATFLKESLLIGFIGGVLGIVFAALTSFASISTTNFSTFSEVAFQFSLTSQAIGKAILFALLMGGLGGALPALRAARLPILKALRSVG